MRAEFVSLFESREFQFDGRANDPSRLPYQYRLFVPDIKDTNAKLPLVLWLHGSGEAGDDNLQQLRWLDQLIITRPWQRARYPFFLLAVQCPSDNRLWFRSRSSESSDAMVDVAMAILDKTVREFPIDTDRVCLAGVSSGGAGCWELASRQPEQFSAVAPMASFGGDLSRVAHLKGVPVWAFNSTRDATTPVDGIRRTVNSLKNAGGVAHLTEVDSADHNCWSTAFEDYHLLEWLLAQRRGAASQSPRPGSISIRGKIQNTLKGWSLPQLVSQASIPIVLIIVILAIRKSRLRERS